MSEKESDSIYLRLSLTDLCNFRCRYCRPQGTLHQPSETSLTLPEIRHLLLAASSCGVKKIRLTGGEPGLRKDLLAVAEVAARTKGIDTVALTTNGTALAPRSGETLHSRLQALRDAGISTLNISLDTLDPQRFADMTGSSSHAFLLEAIDAAARFPFTSIKINAVILRNVNDNEIELWQAYVRSRPVTVRFIELMPTSGSVNLLSTRQVSLLPQMAQCLAEGWTAQEREALAGPAVELSHPNSQGRLGFILPVSAPFCSSCNRIRVDSAGRLHACAFEGPGIPLRHLVQHSLQRQELENTLRNSIDRKKIKEGPASTHQTLMRDFSTLGG